MIERILEILKDKKLSPSQFADEIGIQRSGMSHLISGRNKPSLELIMKVLKRFPDVKPEWLLYGTSAPENDRVNEKIVPAKVPVTLFDEMEQPENRQENRTLRTPKKEKTDKRNRKDDQFRSSMEKKKPASRPALSSLSEP